MNSEIILGVALRITCNGAVVVQKLPQPFRHHHLYRVFKNKTDDSVVYEEGFYTDKRHFIDRQEATAVANKSMSHIKTTNPELFSEDLWSSRLIDLDFTNKEHLKAFAGIPNNSFIHFEKLS